MAAMTVLLAPSATTTAAATTATATAATQGAREAKAAA
jgi:hypothetical protein